MRLRYLFALLFLIGGFQSAAAQGQTGLSYTAVYSDVSGVTHFRNEHLDWDTAQTPGALPILVTMFLDARSLRFVTLPQGYRQDWHPAPARQFVIVMSGVGEIEVGDGTRRTFAAGSVLIVSDTQGRGHRTNVLGDQPVVLAFIPIP
jgi:hypothetical protein